MLTRVIICLFVLSYEGAWCKIGARKFPDGFLFGASTAAYQIEGGWHDDGRGLSIWDVATHTDPSPIKDGSTGDIAADSYHLYEKDIDIAKDLGLDFYRFSISWSRILPDGFTHKINQAGIDYYNRLIDGLLKKNVKPFVTIYHWDLPQNLQKLGGWSNPLIVEWFRDYSRILFEHFGDRVQYWITINEPKQICIEGYGSDLKAPFLNSTGVGDYLCAKHVLLAHAHSYRLYDEQYRRPQNGTIGISISCTWFEPASNTRDDHQSAVDARRFDWGFYAHPIFSRDGDYPLEVKNNIALKSAEQGYPRSRLPELSANEVNFIKGTSDFFGMNSYTSKLTYRDASLEGMYVTPSYFDDMGSVIIVDPTWPQAQSSWLQEVPWGFYKLLTEIKRLYGNPPLYVTENGWSSSGGLMDDDRVNYYKNYLSALLDALDQGSDIRAYTAWSLIDNFEWKNGYTEKFGLYEVDFSSPERTRTPRKSAYVYKEIVRSKHLDLNYDPEDLFPQLKENRRDT